MRGLQAARGAPLSADLPAQDDAGDRRPHPPRRLGLLLTIAAGVLLLDVVTKVLVVAAVEGREPVELLGGLLVVRVSRNPGAAFSLAQGATVLFTLVAVAVVVVILRVSRRLYSRGWAVALGLLLGGASGNLVDRLFRAPGPARGAVVDFLDIGAWPSFNVADSAIVCGAALAVLLSLRGVEPDAGVGPAVAAAPDQR